MEKGTNKSLKTYISLNIYTPYTFGGLVSCTQYYTENNIISTLSLYIWYYNIILYLSVERSGCGAATKIPGLSSHRFLPCFLRTHTIHLLAGLCGTELEFLHSSLTTYFWSVTAESCFPIASVLGHAFSFYMVLLLLSFQALFSLSRRTCESINVL